MKTLVICSDGLDSVALTHKVAAEQELLGILSFDYCQRHRKESAIVTDSTRHGTPFALRWSFCKGGELHCGRCGTCVERREAFDLAGIADPTDYADAEFWRDAVKRGAI